MIPRCGMLKIKKRPQIFNHYKALESGAFYIRIREYPS